MKTIITILLIWFPVLVNAQECKDLIKNYYKSLDTTERKVYLIVDEMPSYFDSNQSSLNRYSKCLDFTKIKCCPNYVWYAFVIEDDGRITNILVCPVFWDCDNKIDIENSKNYVIEQYTKIIAEIKTTAGKNNHQSIAVAHISRVHYECLN